MRILMLAHRIPYPPHTGDKVRSYHIGRYLAQHHQVTLGFLVDDREDLAGVAKLRQEVGEVIFSRLWKPWSLAKGAAGLATGRTLTLPYFCARRLWAPVRERLARGEWDVVYASSSPMAQYAAGVDVPLVMDFVDVDSDKWRQYADRARGPRAWLYRTEARRLQTHEAMISRVARQCVLATGAEDALLRSFAPWARTTVIPNGIDLEYYAPAEVATRSAGIIFTGAMDYLPNADAAGFFADEILPRVRCEVPDAVFYVVGLNPSAAVRRLGERDGIVVTGAVPDVRPYYARAAVCVAPLRIGRGIQNKVLQGMALGLPVVATSVAARGLEATAGRHLHVEDGADGFAARVVRLLRSPEERRVMGRTAREFVERGYSWSASFEKVDDVLRCSVRPHGARTPARVDERV